MQDRWCTFARPNCGETGFFSFASGALFLLADSADDLLRLTPLAHLTVALHVHGRTPCRAEQGKEEDLAVVAHAGQPCVLRGAYMYTTTTTNKSVVANSLGAAGKSVPGRRGGQAKTRCCWVARRCRRSRDRTGRSRRETRRSPRTGRRGCCTQSRCTAHQTRWNTPPTRSEPRLFSGKTLVGQSDKKNNNSQTLRHADTQTSQPQRPLLPGT